MGKQDTKPPRSTGQSGTSGCRVRGGTPTLVTEGAGGERDADQLVSHDPVRLEMNAEPHSFVCIQFLVFREPWDQCEDFNSSQGRAVQAN